MSPVEKKISKKKIVRKKVRFFFSLEQPLATHEGPQKISAQWVQPFGRLYAIYLYTNVLFYYIDEN